MVPCFVAIVLQALDEGHQRLSFSAYCESHIMGDSIYPNKNKVRQLLLSFATANTLRARMVDLPKVPTWKMQDISFTGYKTAKPIVLFYRNPLECIQALLQNPTFEGKWTFSTQQVYDDSSRQNHVYSDWMSGDRAWSAQVSTSYSCLFSLT